MSTTVAAVDRDGTSERARRHSKAVQRVQQRAIRSARAVIDNVEAAGNGGAGDDAV